MTPMNSAFVRDDQRAPVLALYVRVWQAGADGGADSIRRLAIAAAFLACARQTAAPASDAAADGEAIVLGQGYTLQSEVLGEARQINVYVPPGYATGSAAYPVLYLIVVGVKTADRRRELAFPAVNDATLKQEYPTHGESEKFRAFIADAVKSWVEQRYRTDGFDAVIGESLAGLFVAETFLRQPDLFDGYISVDPRLWWDNAALALQARALVTAQPAGEHAVYMAVANGRPQMRFGQGVLAQVMNTAAPDGVSFTYEVMDDEEHSTIYHRAARDALRVVFANSASGE